MVVAESSTATGIARALLVDALGGGDPFGRSDPDDTADDRLDDVAPVRIHIEDEAAARAVVPARPLRRAVAAVEHPPAELEPESDDAPELAPPGEGGELLQSGQIDLVFDRAVLAPARFGFFEQGKALRGGGRHRLFGIDVLAGRQRPGEDGDALLGRGRIEKDRPGRVRKRGVEIGGPFRDVVSARDRRETLAVAAHQQQARHQAVVTEREAAFVMMGTREFARCCVEPMRPVAPLTMIPIVCVAIMQSCWIEQARGGGGETMLCRLHPCPRSGRQRCPATSCA
jgi:hypothetical protein